MKLIYCSCVCSESTYEKLFSNHSKMPGQQVQKYNRTMLKGLAKQENISVEAISKIPVNSSMNLKKVMKLKDEVWNHAIIKYLPYCNILGLNNLWQMCSAFWTMMRVKREKNMFVLLDVLNISLGLGVQLACKIRNIKMIGIVTDLPEYLSQNSNSLFVKKCKKIIGRCHAYVLLTEYMNDYCNPTRKKPYVVIEGQADSDMQAVNNSLEEKHAEKVCLYSGSLNRANGISVLVEGFLKAAIPKAELHIYGDGDYVQELEEICKEHNNIKYFGVKLNKEVISAQIKATLLINPRPTDQPFTKYSFPSKNMEYMASGTPLLTTKLPGMPIDYYPYVYLLEEETSDGIGEILKKLLDKPREELHKKGLKAKKFVLDNKTEVIQADKVVKMIASYNKYSF